MNSPAVRRKRLAVVGYPGLLDVERPVAAESALDELVGAYYGAPQRRRLPDAGAPVKFGGLPIAERGLVRALVRHGSYDDYTVLADGRRQRARFEEDLGALLDGGRLNVQLLREAGRAPDEDLVLHGALSDGVTAIATREQVFTTATPLHLFLSGLSDPTLVVPGAQMLLAAGRIGDCLTALSEANRRTAEGIFDHFSSYYRAHWGVERRFAGRITSAGIGVDVAAFARDEEARSLLRARWRIGPATTVFLYVGRLGASYKADLFPFLLMFDRAFVRAGRDAVLVIAGYDEGAAARLTALVGALAADLRIVVVPDVDAAQKRLLYSAADVFLAPSDNLQETFGVTLVEAMAAGLPVIASDWNGYRETVSHGSNGLLVRASWSRTIADAVDAFGVTHPLDRHLLYAQNVCIDLAGWQQAMDRLASDSALRERMGRHAVASAAGRDWSRVIPALEREWDASLAMTRAAPASDARPTMYGLNLPALHQHYPTDYVPEDAPVTASGPPEMDGEAVSNVMRLVDLPWWDREVWRELYDGLAEAPGIGLAEFLQRHAARTGMPLERVRYYLLRLVKYGFAAVGRPSPSSAEGILNGGAPGAGAAGARSGS